MKPFRTVGVIGKRRDPHLPTIACLCSALSALGCKVLIERNAAIVEDLGCGRVDRDELVAAAELVVVIGGDGSLLDAGRSVAPAGVPLLGVNQGRLGFMADLAPEQISEALPAIIRGEYTVEERMVLAARVRRANGRDEPERFMAINDVVLRNQASIRMLEFESWADDEFISVHRADGMIVCSPTGSTAYALSGGGPLIHPGLQAMALVPICPHTLSDRPIVVPGERRVRLVVRGEERGVPLSEQRSQANATIDGQTSTGLEPGDSVEVTRADTPLRLIHPCSYGYFEILRHKLRWGRDQDTPVER